MKKILLFAGLCLGALLTPFASAQAAPFLATFRTTTANESITLPLVDGYTYNFTVDWNDPNDPGTDTITAYDQAEINHTYAVAGDYQISITGTMPYWNFFTGSTASKDQIISLDDDGDVGFGVGVGSFDRMFYSCLNLESVALFDTSSGTAMEWMFAGCTSLTTIPLFVTNSVSNFKGMFLGASALTSIPLINTSNGATFYEMFRGAASLSTIPELNLSEGTSFFQMFYGASALTSLPNLNTLKGVDMRNMFRQTTKLVSIAGLDLSSAGSVAGMFQDATSLTNLPTLSAPNATNFWGMFYGASSIESVAITDASLGQDFSAMFYNASSLTSFSLATPEGMNFANMFNGATSLTTVSLSDVSKGTNFSRMFNDASSLNSVSTLYTPQGENFSEMFVNCSALPSVTLTDTSSGTNFLRIFEGATILTSGVPTGAKYSLDYTDTALPYAALQALFAGVGTADNSGGQQTLDITGNPGVTSLTAADYAVVEAKDWVVIPAYTPTCTDGVKNGDEVGVDCGGSCTDTCFAATFNTASANESITLPLVNGYTYDFYVDWGDGTQDYITSYNQAERTHTYSGAGNHQVNISGSMPMWKFYIGSSNPNGGSHAKIISLDDDGDVGFGVGVTDFSWMFGDTSSLTSLALFDTSAGTNFTGMFWKASALSTIPGFNFSAGTNFRGLFNLATNLSSIPDLSISGGGNPVDFSYMFANTPSLTSIPYIDTGNGTTFERMFWASGIVNLPESPYLDVSSGTNFASMFADVTTLQQGALTGTQYTISYASNQMDVTALRELFSEIGTADNSGGQQILNITGNPGVVSLTAADYAVVEAKDWSVAPAYTPTCSDGYKNGDEVGVDCGGSFCGACEVIEESCANITTAYFEQFFYHDNPQIQAITTALTDYHYYDCDNKIFRIGNESNDMEDISMMLALRLTTAELDTMNANKTATHRQSYYNTDLGLFMRGLDDGSLEAVNEDERKLTGAEIAAMTNAVRGEFYYNKSSGQYYIGEIDGTLSQLFVRS